MPFTVLSRELGQPAAPPRCPSPFASSEPAALEQVVREAAFVEVRSELFPVTFTFSSVDELVGHLGDVSAPLRAVLATLSPERQAELKGKVAAAAAAVAFAAADGTIRLSNDCLIVAGQH